MDNTDKYIGMMLDNRYEILEKVGEGGMAVVYKARCHRLNRFVAVKILREEFSKDDEFRRRFHAESQAVAMLSHPNIVAVYDVNRSNGIEYLVMELIDGITLKQYISRKGKLNWREALHFTTQIVRALSHAHSRGIIHRDIKPQNIMLLRDGSVKVADFGIARFAASQNTLTQEALGSVHYISPEQAKGGHVDARSDIYSAGVVLYEMLTSRLPFEGDSAVSVAIQHINSMPLTPREIDPSIPAGLEEITMKAMNPDLAKRYASADDMLRDLEEFRKNPDTIFSATGDSGYVEPEEEPTKQIPQIYSGSIIRQRETQAEQEVQTARESSVRTRPRRDRSFGMIIAVIAIFVFVGGLIFFLWGVVKPILYPETEKITVPDLIGETYDSVMSKKDTEYIDFEFELSDEVIYDDNPAGTIVDQKPDGGRSANIGDTITLYVSKGTKALTMDNYENMEYRSVEIELQKLGISAANIRYEYENNEAIVKDYVIRTIPAAGEGLGTDEIVTLYVSLGPTVEKVIMPDLMNRTEAEAQDLLTSKKLVLGGITGVESQEYEKGRIANQSILPGTEIDEGTQVFLQVSLGVPETEPTTEAPTTEAPTEPTQTSTEPTGETGTLEKMIWINLPTDREEVRVTVKVDGIIAYDQVVSTSHSSIPVHITGNNTRVWVDIYFDEKLEQAEEVMLSE